MNKPGLIHSAIASDFFQKSLAQGLIKAKSHFHVYGAVVPDERCAIFLT